MLAFILRRIAEVMLTFLGITVLSFAFIHLIPGDPVLIMMGERAIDPQFYRQTLEKLGLDQPLYQQYWHYLVRVLQGDFGQSFVTHASVLDEFRDLFPATLELSVCAMLFATIGGMAAGILAAIHRGSWLDRVTMGWALVGYSMPIFWWGLVLMMVFSNYLGVLPVSGRIDLTFDFPPVTGLMLVDSLLAGDWAAFRSALVHLVLPAFVLGTIPLAVIARMTRSAMLEVLREDYIRTARAKGVSRTQVVLKHALRNALISIVTVISLQISTMLTGAILTETIFSWPGIGKWLISAISRRDYPVIQGGILLVAALIIFINLIVDVLYGVIHPRILHARS